MTITIPSWLSTLATFTGAIAVIALHYVGYDLEPEVVAAVLGPQAASAVASVIARMTGTQNG